MRVFENRVLRKVLVFWAKMDGVTLEWRKLHNEEHSLPNIIRVIISRREGRCL
jgi:hypothetical protein